MSAHGRDQSCQSSGNGVPPPPPQVTLHQQDLERIDVLNDECKELEILYLQNNLIGRIGAPPPFALGDGHPISRGEGEGGGKVY